MSSTTSPSPVIVWLRNDLRLDDHAPLTAAIAGGGTVAPVFCIDPRAFRILPSGMRKTGAFRARFLLESLHDLRRACRGCGGDLIVRIGAPESVLPVLAGELSARRVLVHEEVASEETQVEVAVATALQHVGAHLERFQGHTLLHPDDLPFDRAAVPDLFTTFRTRVEREMYVRAPIDAPVAFRSPTIEAGEIPDAVSVFGLTEPEPDPHILFAPSGGESAGRDRLDHFVWRADRLRHYKVTRNGMLTLDDSTKLSPWLSMGCVSPRRVWAEVQRYERERVKNDSTYWLGFELLWRDYFRFLLAKYGPSLFALGGPQRLGVAWRSLTDDAARADFTRWTSGTTGFPLVDASMRELARSGFMSNRGRQNVASFLTKNLRIDWRAGATWFESLLVDYDAASNWGNWAYAAGVGTDARGFRCFNIHKQALDYDPMGAFVRHWIPELDRVPGAAVHRPERLSPGDQQRFGVTLGVTYPAPMVDLFVSAAENERLYQQARDLRSR